MAHGVKTGGRKKGTINKFTASAKEAFQLAFDEMGGASELKAWALENQTQFYKLYSRLIPVDATINGNVTVEVLRFADKPA